MPSTPPPTSTVKVGYALSCEELPPAALVANARRAEECGFPFALISDHFHPWTHRQGNSAFVWSVIGAISQVTDRLELGTGVTCPTVRIHPAIIAQAAATAGTLLPGRFFLGVGTGENLNEHVLGHRWPNTEVRREMLEEAMAVIRNLWQGGIQSHTGTYYTVDEACIFTLPDQLPPIMVAASGPQAAELAGRIGDGFIGTSPDQETISAFRSAGGDGKPCYGQLTVCWAEDEDEARRTAYEWWPNAALGGELTQELPSPRHFEQAAALASEDDVAEIVVCGPDPGRHVEHLQQYIDAGYDHIYVHQVGPDQEGFFRFYQEKVLPKL